MKDLFNTLSSRITALLILAMFLPAVFVGTTSCDESKEVIPDSVLAKRRQDSIAAAEAQKKEDQEDFLKAIARNGDTNTVYVSSPEDLNVPYDTDINAGKNIKRVYNGRRINIAVTGLDARVGTVSNHADANHVISILIDSGVVEIITVPRDTPADAGMTGDDSLQNKLTVVRAGRGRSAYHKELARIAGLDKIHHFVELGFSQAIGMLELLGYKDARNTLQVLRSRKALGGDDYQRCYNQAQFIRQMLLRHFDKFQGLIGEVVIRGGLSLLDSDMDAATVKDIVAKLKAKGFPKSKSDITIKVRPPIPINYRVFDFTDQSTVDGLGNRIEDRNRTHGSDNDTSYKSLTNKLMNVIKKAKADSVKSPAQVIKSLKVYADQRAWLQVRDTTARNYIRDEVMSLLSYAYTKTKKPQEAKKVIEAINNEKKLFDSDVLKKTTR